MRLRYSRIALLPLSLVLAFIMFAILIISTLLLLFSYLSYRENTHPLWSEYVAVSENIPKPHGKPNSIEMVFFWKNCSSYKYSTEKDYWNSMAIHCFKEGLLVKRSFFLFWRKPIFISWSRIEEKHNFREWIAKRRALQIKNTSLYFSITESAYQQRGKMVKDES